MRQSTSFWANPFLKNELVTTEAAELRKASSCCQLIVAGRVSYEQNSVPPLTKLRLSSFQVWHDWLVKEVASFEESLGRREADSGPRNYAVLRGSQNPACLISRLFADCLASRSMSPIHPRYFSSVFSKENDLIFKNHAYVM